jgi:CheY-like chemotaxis protein
VLLIAVTGYGQASDRERTRDAGFHHHLVKPVHIEAIEATLTAIPTR